MARAIWNGEVIAESDSYQQVEGNVYFPPDRVRWEYLKPIEKTTVCPWKGTAHYYTLMVNGKENEGAAWTYPEPSEKAKHIKDYIAFWKGVSVSE
jgi:uncharacterized protein (DUF427 family)